MSDYNDPSEDIRTETSNNLMNEDSMLYNNNKNKNIKTLSKVYEIIKNNNNENYSINKYNNDINKWKIKINGKHPLIMDFSKQTKCDLSLITYLEGRKDQKVADYVSCNIKINLNEKIIDLCDKIEIFLQYMVKLYNVQSKKCDICYTIKRMIKYIIDKFNVN